MLEAQLQFEQWRRTRTSRSIFDNLWTLSIELAERHELYPTIRALKVDFATFKKRIGISQRLFHRDENLPAPIQLCDGLSLIIPENFATLAAKCIPYGRRKIVDIIASSPDESRHVLELFSEIYRIENVTVKLAPNQAS